MTYARRMRRFVLIASLFALAGCSSPEHLAVVANSPGSLGVGEQRITVGYRSESGEDLANPQVEVDLVVSREGGEDQRVDTEFVWIAEPIRGVYVAHVTFDQAGEWTAVLEPEEGPRTRDTPFFIDAEPSTPEVGEPAPASVTPTSGDLDLAELTTDPAPDPGLYEVSVDEAVTNGTPALITFATPAYCSTATCGPMLEQVKSLRAAMPDAGMDWIQVEVYDLTQGNPVDHVVPAAVDWGLPSEPWIFVVDAEGVVTARLEGVVSDAELQSVVEAVLGA